MSSIREDYMAPWWTYWLHNFPHVNLNFQPIDNTFTPQDQNYQQVRGRHRYLAHAGLIISITFGTDLNPNILYNF